MDMVSINSEAAKLNALMNVKGAIRLARTALLREAGDSEDLAAAMGALALAEGEVDRIHGVIDREGIEAAQTN